MNKKVYKLVREIEDDIEYWIDWSKKNNGKTCGCAPMHNDGPCLEHQIMPKFRTVYNAMMEK